MKKKLIWILVCAAAVAAIGYGAIKLFTRKPAEIKYREVRATWGSISLAVNANGTVKPRNRLEIRPPIAGRIDEILVVEGSHIKKGDILVWMSSLERAALLDTARSKGTEELKRWSDVYKPTPVIAPLNGFIIRRNTEPGQTISAQDAILVMADELIIKAQVDETDMGKLKTGQSAVIRLDAYPEKQFPGVVEHIAYESEIISNVTVYYVDIKPRETLNILRSGMSADIDIRIIQKDNALLLPSYAVNETRRVRSVLVKNGQGTPERRKITTGIDDGEMFEVLDGVDETDIILVGASGVSDPRTQRRGGLPGMGGRTR